MTFKQFLFINRKNKRGETNLWPPIGDIILIVFGTCYYWLQNDSTYILGLVLMVIGMICFCISYVQFKQQSESKVDSK